MKTYFAVIVLSAALFLAQSFNVRNVKNADTPFWKAVLNAHNKYRAMHSAPPLTWNREIAQFTEAWCNKLKKMGKIIYSSRDDRDGRGENLYTKTHVSRRIFTSLNAAEQAEEAVERWYSEKDNYDFSDPGYQANTAHFTNVIWKSTKQLGCGYAFTDDTYWTCCNYYPAGNVLGLFVENVPKAKSEV